MSGAAIGPLVVALVVGAAGCGGAPDPVSPGGRQEPPGSTATPGPGASASATPESPTPESGAPESGAPVDLPWPTSGDDPVAALQRQVDAGSQPWLLEPTEVALSFAADAYGWTRAEATQWAGGPGGPGDPTTVDVRGAGGDSAALTLRQPGRTGAGGVWVVTDAHRG